MYAMNAARHRFYPRAKPLGMTSVQTLCAFTSEDVLFYGINLILKKILESLLHKKRCSCVRDWD